MEFSVEIVVHDPTPEELEIAELNREATRHKTAGDWPAAIACLRRAREIALAHDLPRGVESSLRLPLFLQQGGHFDAAMLEFNRLLNEADALSAFGLDHLPEFFRTGHAHRARGLIYGKMRLACQREKRPDLATQYAAASGRHYDEFARYRKMMDMHREREGKKRDAKLAALRAQWKEKQNR